MGRIKIINNARWLNPDGSFGEGHIIIRGDKISKLNEGAYAAGSDGEVIDAGGLLVLPGAIDPHVHFREPGQLYKEGILNGSRAALRGGVTTVIDMPNNKPPLSTRKRVEKKLQLFRKKSLVNWGVMYHTSGHNQDDVGGLIRSAKIYMAKSSALPAVTSPELLQRLFARFPVVSIHAEDETAFDTSPQRSPLHHENRPRRAITLALEKIGQALKSLKKSRRPRVIICHMNTADEVVWLKRMKAEGLDVWGETCPHYLYFTQDDYIRHGTAFQVNPPIRSQADQQALRQGLADGIIDFIGTDHAPHARAEKSSDRPPSGIAAIEWLMPQMLHLLDQQVIAWPQFTAIMCASAAQAYSINGRGGIREGNFADLVLVEQGGEGHNAAPTQTRAGVNLYADFDFRWRVRKTFVNGVLKYEDGRFYETIKGKEV